MMMLYADGKHDDYISRVANRVYRRKIVANLHFELFNSFEKKKDDGPIPSHLTRGHRLEMRNSGKNKFR